MNQIVKASDLRPPQTEDGGRSTEDRGSPPADRGLRPGGRSEVRDQSSASRGESSSAFEQSTLNSQLLTSRNVALLTAGRDRPYALGLASALIFANISFDFIGSDAVNGPELHHGGNVRFLNFRDQRSDAGHTAKMLRVLAYYWRLIRYAMNGQPKLFHILWNNKFEFFDRTLLMLYYKLMGKRLVITAHNVNARKRDGTDFFLNRLSLQTQYRLSDHIFVHTERMKGELTADFGIQENKVSVIPFGINNTVPNTILSTAEAKRQLGVSGGSDKTVLFFGNIAPYKGLEYLVAAFAEALKKDRSYCLIIAGKPKESADYWKQIQEEIARRGISDRVIERIEYVPDEQTELYFKAADVLALPYTRIFQSGVLFLGYSFGLPVIAADVGPLKEEIVEGKTGFVFKPQDSSDLARAIANYFESDLFRSLESRRAEIKEYANERYSWDKVVRATTAVYSDLLRGAEDRGRKAEDR
jgi:glycosyltransferase involved in cell wall biosynthesis